MHKFAFILNFIIITQIWPKNNHFITHTHIHMCISIMVSKRAKNGFCFIVSCICIFNVTVLLLYHMCQCYNVRVKSSIIWNSHRISLFVVCFYNQLIHLKPFLFPTEFFFSNSCIHRRNWQCQNIWWFYMDPDDIACKSCSSDMNKYMNSVQNEHGSSEYKKAAPIWEGIQIWYRVYSNKLQIRAL